MNSYLPHLMPKNFCHLHCPTLAPTLLSTLAVRGAVPCLLPRGHRGAEDGKTTCDGDGRKREEGGE